MSTDRRVAFFSKLSQLIYEANKRGVHPAIFWLHRTPEQQFELYKKGRKQLEDGTWVKIGPTVTNCDGYKIKSKHQPWEAGDLCIIYAGGAWQWGRVPEYETLGRIAKEIGLRWGGDWDGDEIRDPNDYDIYHFELP